MSTVVIGGSGSVDIYGKCRGGKKTCGKILANISS